MYALATFFFFTLSHEEIRLPSVDRNVVPKELTIDFRLKTFYDYDILELQLESEPSYG